MGNVSSSPNEGAALCLRDQTRLSISSLTVTNARKNIVVRVAPDAFPTRKIIASRDMGDPSMLDYVQDPDVTANALPNFLLKIDNDAELTFTFTFVMRPVQCPPIGPDDAQALVDSAISNLTFIAASTAKEVENLVTLEFHADPNLHKNNNVHLVGDYATTGAKSVTFEWSWRWRPPKPQEDRGAGWRNCCSFVEYDQRAHRLNTLAIFSFWVHNGHAQFSNPNSPSPVFALSAPPRIRIPSSQSVDSRGSALHTLSDYEDVPSPIFEQSKDSLAVPPQSSGSLGKQQQQQDLPTPSPQMQAPPPLAPKVDVTCQRPGEDLSAQEDGPLFRATMKALEQKTGVFRQRMKKVIKRGQEYHEAQVKANDAAMAFTEALKEASSSNAHAVLPAMDHYFNKIAAEILMYEKRNARNLKEFIIEPLGKVYEMDIKKAEQKKKEFEDESSTYYQYLSRYLGQKQDAKEKKKEESDAKYQTKRRTFELKRFDYGCFMQDLHGGRKEQEVLSWLTKYADNQTKSYLTTAGRVKGLVPELEALSTEVDEADKAFNYTRTEREEKRRTIEMSTATYQAPDSLSGIPRPPASSNSTGNQTSYISDSDLLQRSSSVAHRNGTSLAPVRTKTDGTRTPNSEASAGTGPSPRDAQNKFKGIRDLEEKDHTLQQTFSNGTERKEGLLWALSKPGSHVDPKGLNKTAWHKYGTFVDWLLFWIVLDQGTLSEYSNWKEQLDLHMDPIDLRLASVREARNADRRFTFEVITPQFTRVYQAPSQEDMNSWISAIGNAIQTAMEGRSLPSRGAGGASGHKKGESMSPGLGRIGGRDIGSILTGKSPSVSHAQAGAGTVNSKDLYRRTTVGGRPSYNSRKGSQADSINGAQDPDRLLQQLRDLSEDNKWCADCGSGVKTEWVSINLGVILCIECSGIHRSLGTHVSKIRSLTLDTQSFTSDIVALLRIVGNAVSNAIYEATLLDHADVQKPPPTASRDQRLKYITWKYVDKAFVAPLHPTLSPHASADELLITSIKKNDINGALHALALKASPNATDRSRGTHAVFLALAAADPAPPGTMGGGISSSLPHTSSMRPGTSSSKPLPIFPVAEVLVLNGAEVPNSGPLFPLGVGARAWLDAKRRRDSGRLTPLEHAASTGSTSGSSYAGGSSYIGAGGAIGGGEREKSGDGKQKTDKLQKRISAGGRLAGLGRSS